MAERRLFDGVIHVGVIVNPTNVTVSLQNWDFSAFIAIPFLSKACKKIPSIIEVLLNR